MRAWLVLLALLPVRDALACVIVVGDPPFAPTGPPTETNAPGPVTIGNPTVTVVEIDEGDGCGEQQDSCSGLGYMVLTVPVAASDDTTSSLALGYRVRIVRGTQLFGGNRLEDRLGDDGSLELFISGPMDVDTDLGISAIDESGNVGPETIVNVVHVVPRDGCRSSRSGRPFGALALAMATMALMLLRRRHRATPSRALHRPT